MTNQGNPFRAAPRAFISYARADGEAAATSLRQRLEREHPDIVLWHDRLRMEGGLGWWKQITEAIDHVEFLIMVMTPAAMVSEVARKEWRYARQQGVRICPVLVAAADEFEFSALPSWMSKVHFYDLEKEWDTFTGFLRSASKDTRVPFMAPDVRDVFIERKEFHLLLETLLDLERSNPVASTTALQGGGGFGKTTLAIALCHHEAVVGAFDDGILWATLGQDPKPQAELTKLYAALTGDRPAFIDVDDAAMHLANRLEDKNCLLILDDVWDLDHVRPFLRGGKTCARLITTRVLQVTTLAAKRIVVSAMSEEQSVQLLNTRLGATRLEDLAQVRELARRLGDWPLLLKLASSQLRERIERGAKLDDAIAYVNQALQRRGVEAFDRTSSQERHEAVASTVGASLTVLDAEDRSRGVELAVFPRGVAIPLSAISALWGLDAFETEELVQRLDNVALIDFDLRTASIRLHDVVQSYLYELIEDVKSLHVRLTREGWKDLYRLPDSYAWRRIGWHLVEAGDGAQLQRLLTDYDWLKAKLQATDVQALLDDFELLANVEALNPLHNALRLASHGLTRDADQLAAQLIGRLEPGVSSVADALLAQARSGVQRPWLTLTQRSLTSPGGALLSILKAHAGPVQAVVLGSDGGQVASASADGTIRIWELGSGRVIRLLEGHTGWVHCLTISADGRKLVSGSEDRSVRIWDIESGHCERTLVGHYGPVHGVAVVPGDERIVSVSEDGRVCCASAGGKQQQIFKTQSHQLRPIAVTSDGARLLFAADNWTIALGDLASATVIRTFEGHEGNVRALALTPDGKHALSGAEDATIRLWDLATGETLRVFEGHTGSVDALALVSDGRRLISGAKDQTLRVWDLESGRALRILEGHSGSIRALAVTSAGTHAISASSDRTLRYWQLDGVTGANLEKAHLGAVSMIAASADGTRAVSGARNEVLKVWDVSSGRSVRTLEEGDPEDARARLRSGLTLVNERQQRLGYLGMAPDGSRALAAFSDRRLCSWEAESGAMVGELRGSVDGRQVAISRDGSLAVSLLRDATVRASNLGRNRQFRLLAFSGNDRVLETLGARSALLSELDLGLVIDVAPFPLQNEGLIGLSADSRCVLLGFYGSLVRWDLHSGRADMLALDDFDVTSAAIEAGGRFAVVGSRFGSLRVVDLITMKTALALEGHDGAVLDIVLAEDARRAFSASRDDTIRSWDLELGRELGCLRVQSGKVDEVALSRSGCFAYSINGDTIVASSLQGMKRVASLSIDHQITALSLSEGGRQVVLGDESGRVHFLTLES